MDKRITRSQRLLPPPTKPPRFLSPPKTNRKSKYNCNKPNEGVPFSTSNQGESHGSKRIKMGSSAKKDTLWDTSSTPDLLTPTLHDRTLNNAQQTVKGLYVDGQQRYVVERRISKIQNKSGVVVTYKIKAEASDEQRKLILKDMWAEVDWMSPGTLINIVGVSADENQCFVVEHMNGYLIVEPDRLMPVTSVVTQMYCERKAALSHFISGGGDNALMYREDVARELINKAMAEKIGDIADLKVAAKNICKRPQMLERAYGIGITDKDLMKVQTSAAEWVNRFMNMRFFGTATNFMYDTTRQNFDFEELLGVEQNIWSPTYGLKGKIDATVSIKKDGMTKIRPMFWESKNFNRVTRIAARSVNLTRATLIGVRTPSASKNSREYLLHSISDNQLFEENLKTTEFQKLIMKRNKLIRSISLSDGDLPYLPRPDGIDYEFKCKTCEVRNFCTLQLRKTNIPENEQLKTEKALLANCKLSDEEFQFFEHWFKVITAETEEVEKRYNDKNLWTVAPEVREAAGTCVANLVIVGDCVARVDPIDKPGFLAIFKKTETSSQSSFSLRVNDFVTLSSNVEVCINQGVVVALRDNEITLSLDQALHREYKTGNFTYAIDKMNTTSPIASQYSYLMKLMEDSPDAERLRQYIIMKKEPMVGELPFPDMELQEIVKGLNTEQRMVIWRSSMTDSFLFVKGTPGSGKTTSTVRLMRALVHAQKSILVVSYSDLALDRILKKFQEHSQDFIKISSSSAGDACVRPCTTKEVSKAADSITKLTELYNKPVVGTALLNLKHAIFEVRRFDFCIFHGASQALPTAVFGALAVCDKYVVFGDPNQLPPLVQSSLMKNLNICDNFFSLMASPVSTIKLNTQYRMNAGITKLANDLIYEKEIQCVYRALEKRYLKLAEADIRKELIEEVESPAARNLLCHVVSKKFEKAAVFIDTSDVPAFESRVEESICNEAEVLLRISFVNLIIRSGLPPSRLGIVAPFRAQVDLLRKNLRSLNFGEVEVNTVDQYQGREKEVILCTFTKSLSKDSLFLLDTSEEKKESILEDMRYLSVAITRARSKVVLLGNRDTLKEYSPFKKLFEVMSTEQIRKLTKEEYEGLNLYANRMKDIVSSTASVQV